MNSSERRQSGSRGGLAVFSLGCAMGVPWSFSAQFSPLCHFVSARSRNFPSFSILLLIQSSHMVGSCQVLMFDLSVQSIYKHTARSRKTNVFFHCHFFVLLMLHRLLLGLLGFLSLSPCSQRQCVFQERKRYQLWGGLRLCNCHLLLCHFSFHLSNFYHLLSMFLQLLQNFHLSCCSRTSAQVLTAAGYLMEITARYFEEICYRLVVNCL